MSQSSGKIETSIRTIHSVRSTTHLDADIMLRTEEKDLSFFAFDPMLQLPLPILPLDQCRHAQKSQASLKGNLIQFQALFALNRPPIHGLIPI